MLEEIIKIDATAKFFLDSQTQEEYSEYYVDSLCSGKVYKVLSESEIEIKIKKEDAIFEKKTCYGMYIVSSEKVYLCRVMYKSSFQEEDFEVIVLEILSPLENVQRRVHQRVSCHSRLAFREVTKEEENVLRTKIEEGVFSFQPQEYEDSLVDISGGGIRFTSKRSVTQNEELIVSFEIESDSERKSMIVYGKVVSVGTLRNETEYYDIRMKYIDITKQEREKIIQFVFLLERSCLGKK